MAYTPEAVVYFIDKVLGITHASLQRAIDNYGHHSHLFDLFELRDIAIEFGAIDANIKVLKRAVVEVSYQVPNDTRRFSRIFYFTLNDKHAYSGTV